MTSSHASNNGGERPVFGNALIGNLNDVNFQFEFPKFGQLPGPTPPPSYNASLNGRPSASPQPTRSLSDHVSPTDKAAGHISTGTTGRLDAQTKEDLAKFSGIFSPPLTNNNVASAARGSTDSHNSGTNESSPSSSSNSNGGPSSSCGTSPEPSNQSPVGFKPDVLTTIGEDQQLSLAATNHGKEYHESLWCHQTIAPQRNCIHPSTTHDYYPACGVC